MEKYPLAIMIPAYDKPKEFRFLLEGLVNQYNFSNFYTIVVNDNAENPKEIKKVCDEYKNKLHLIYFQNKKNLGPGPCRNIGIDWCAKRDIDYIMFLDSDDFIAPGAVKYMLNFAIKNNYPMVFDNWLNLFENSTSTPSNGVSCLLYVFYKIYKVSAIGDLRFLDMRIAEDVCFNLCFLDRIPNVQYINSISCSYYHKTYDDSLTSTRLGVVSYKNSIYYYHLLAIRNFLKYSKSPTYIDTIFTSYLFNLYPLYENGIICCPTEEDKINFDKVVTEILEDKRIQELYNCALNYIDEGNILSYQQFCKYADGAHFSTYDEITQMIFFKDTFLDFLQNHGFTPEIDCSILKNPYMTETAYII